MPAQRLQLRAAAHSLHLRHPFAITRGSVEVEPVSFLRLSDNSGRQGWGEADPDARYHGEERDADLAALSALGVEIELDLEDEAAVTRLLPEQLPAARCALDTACADLAAQQAGLPLWTMWGGDAANAPLTSVSLGISSLAETLEKLEEVSGAPVLKVKVGTGGEEELLAAIRERFAGRLRIDANEGWDPATAERTLRALARFDVEFCEQPIPAGNLTALRALSEASPIPVMADEDCVVLADIAPLGGVVWGVNIKLQKCGGPRPALRMIAAARAAGLRIMLGCMLESTVGCAAAAHLSPLVDFADLDGALLIADDPFEGLGYEAGRLVLPSTPGLGVRPRSGSNLDPKLLPA